MLNTKRFILFSLLAVLTFTSLNLWASEKQTSVLLQIPQLCNLCARNKMEPMCREAHTTVRSHNGGGYTRVQDREPVVD